VKDAHFKKHPDWKWCSKERKKSKSGNKCKSEAEQLSSSEEGLDTSVPGNKLKCLVLANDISLFPMLHIAQQLKRGFL
jgi:hypothetical protein